MYTSPIRRGKWALPRFGKRFCRWSHLVASWNCFSNQLLVFSVMSWRPPARHWGASGKQMSDLGGPEFASLLLTGAYLRTCLFRLHTDRKSRASSTFSYNRGKIDPDCIVKQAYTVQPISHPFFQLHERSILTILITCANPTYRKVRVDLGCCENKALLANFSYDNSVDSLIQC